MLVLAFIFEINFFGVGDRVLPLTSRESRETTSYHPKAYKHAEKQIMSSKEQKQKKKTMLESKMKHQKK